MPKFVIMLIAPVMALLSSCSDQYNIMGNLFQLFIVHEGCVLFGFIKLDRLVTAAKSVVFAGMHSDRIPHNRNNAKQHGGKTPPSACFKN